MSRWLHIGGINTNFFSENNRHRIHVEINKE